MNKILLIVESPKKAKTLSTILGQEYKILSTYGHIFDLPKGDLGVDLNSFEADFVTNLKSKKILKTILEEALNSKEIILATDPDREGEAISFHLNEQLKRTKLKISRIELREISQKEVLEKLNFKRAINIHLVEAQFSRRILDRLFGYLLSPVLWKSLKNNKLSSGRVQSIALKWIVEREEEIESFKPEEYWDFLVLAEVNGNPIEFSLELEDKILSSEQASKILEKILGKKINNLLEQNLFEFNKKIKIKNIESKEIIYNAPSAFITSSLQKEASNLFHWSPEKTMRIAQSLYEGVGNLGGLITYMRTDSTRLSDESKLVARQYIEKKFGKEYLSNKEIKKKQNKNIQDAHEAIRPITPFIPFEKLEKNLSKEELKLYKLIFNRFLASQMKEAIYEQQKIFIEYNGFKFSCTKKNLIFKGYKVFEDEFEQTNQLKVSLEDTINTNQIKVEQKFTKPPSRFTEASLIEKLEKTGIGRPSTYATILTTLYKRKYTSLKQKKLIPESISFEVISILKGNFNKFLDNDFTKNMEDSLDLIANGNLKRDIFLREFYNELSKHLEKRIVFQKRENKNEICPKCAKKLYKKRAKGGKEYFLCSNFPICDYMNYI